MLSPEWLETIAPVGKFIGPGMWSAFGAGVFIGKHHLVWLVTANHVVRDVQAREVSILVTQAASGVNVVEVGKLLEQNGLAWVRDEANDLAAAPVPISDQFRMKAIPPEYCARLSDLLPSMTAYSIGCPYGLRGVDPQRATPLVLDGVIAGVDAELKRIYTSAPTFPGNSGGPLVVVKQPFTADGRLHVGTPTVLLAGIMLESLLALSPKPGDATPPLHMGRATPMDAALALLDSDAARQIANKLTPPPAS